MHFAQSRCRACDLVFSNPMADDEELERYYRTRYYEDHEREYNAHSPEIARLIQERVAAEVPGLRRSVLPYVQGGRFFEIGAGYGALLAAARELGFSPAGIEPSDAAARIGRELLGLDDLRSGMFKANDWAAASCDVIYSFQVIEHVTDLHAFAAGTFRMLKPGGLMIVGTENHHNIWVDVCRMRSWLEGRRLMEFQTADHHTYYFSDRSLTRLLEQHGFRVVKCLVYTPPLAEKLARSRFRSVFSKLAFYALHYADVWTGRGGRVLVWCRRPA
ncbi:MAG: class I SAM-dependent methyltransferase [Acidobacteria bacterium]|nr:class I SAM-dependent methyltransferase [Acidobacteriota bacterium]